MKKQLLPFLALALLFPAACPAEEFTSPCVSGLKDSASHPSHASLLASLLTINSTPAWERIKLTPSDQARIFELMRTYYGEDLKAKSAADIEQFDAVIAARNAGSEIIAYRGLRFTPFGVKIVSGGYEKTEIGRAANRVLFKKSLCTYGVYLELAAHSAAVAAEIPGATLVSFERAQEVLEGKYIARPPESYQHDLGIHAYLRETVVNGQNVVSPRLMYGHPLEGASSVRSIVLMDIDDTLLKEVPLTDRHRPGVIAIEYNASPLMFQIYQQQLVDGCEPGRVIHYEILDPSTRKIRSYLSLRPGLAALLTALSPSATHGKVQPFLASANDPNRTLAIFDQVRIDGRSLGSFGVRPLERSRFMTTKTVKDMEFFRKEMKLSDTTKVLLLDDKPEFAVRSSPYSHVLGIAPYDHTQVQRVLTSNASILREHTDYVNALIETLLATLQ